MSGQPQGPARLPSEDVIISAPMSYTGSAQRIIRLRRRARSGRQLAAITLFAIVIIVIVWVLVTAWYLTWGLLLVPYRLVRRGARKRKLEAMRHRELMGTIQGSAAASSAAIVAAMAGADASNPGENAGRYSPIERIGDADREAAIESLREHMLAGRLTAEEFEERLGSAHKARTRVDLDAVNADLPASKPTRPPPPDPHQAW
ncbi:MAG: DUF1707 domain-containing protein [Solirubrobacteraceae bacterium]|jgi:hypothetical protein